MFRLFGSRGVPVWRRTWQLAVLPLLVLCLSSCIGKEPASPAERNLNTYILQQLQQAKVHEHVTHIDIERCGETLDLAPALHLLDSLRHMQAHLGDACHTHPRYQQLCDSLRTYNDDLLTTFGQGTSSPDSLHMLHKYIKLWRQCYDVTVHYDNDLTEHHVVVMAADNQTPAYYNRQYTLYMRDTIPAMLRSAEPTLNPMEP